MPHLTYQSAITLAAGRLQEAGIEAPRREARLLLAHLLGVPARRLPPADAVVEEAALRALVCRRAAREPLCFITGTQGFWTLELEVSPATLIPRADSETLIEAALDALPDRARRLRMLDLGTGTGCLLLAALSEYPAGFGIGVDLVPAAAALAARNAARLGLADRACFLAGSWMAPLRGRFDLILSNPPYIETASIPGLMPEVALHEPATALDGGADGMAVYSALMPALAAHLAPGGTAILELGQGQMRDAAALAVQAGFSQIFSRRDLGGMERALILHAAY